jgi:hypothetical protein
MKEIMRRKERRRDGETEKLGDWEKKEMRDGL